MLNIVLSIGLIFLIIFALCLVSILWMKRRKRGNGKVKASLGIEVWKIFKLDLTLEEGPGDSSSDVPATP